MRAKCAYYWQKMRLTYLSHFITRQSKKLLYHTKWTGNTVYFRYFPAISCNILLQNLTRIKENLISLRPKTIF